MNTRRFGIILVAVAAALAPAGCDSPLFGGGLEYGTVTIAYVEWANAVAITHVAKTILEDEGFTVELQKVSNADMWANVASGEAHVHLAGWLPDTHADFWGPSGQYTDQIADLGAHFEGAQIGLVVPSYATINSLAQLDADTATYGGEIQGIDPGAGLMQTTQSAIDADTYGLGDWTLIDGSGPAMTDALGTAVDSSQPIVVTGWRPHWMFGKWDLKFLDDPEKAYGNPEAIHTMANKQFVEDSPDMAAFFEHFDWLQLELQEVMVDIQEGSTPEQAARAFVDAHQTEIDELLPDEEDYQ